MSEHLLKILLSELRLIRVRCKGCQSVTTIEVLIRELGANQVLSGARCPFCQNHFRPPQGPNPFDLLAKAFNGLDQLGQAVDVEFVVPLESKSGAATP